MTQDQSLTLASSSERRLRLLAQIGVTPGSIVIPNIDETPERFEHPKRLAWRLARRKYEKVAKTNECNSVVLAADTVVGRRNKIYPKATTKAQALDCLLSLSGHRHVVYTGVTIGSQRRRPKTILVRTKVKFKRLSSNEIDRYLNTNEWHDRAGGYAIVGKAAMFVSRIEGSYSNILGLPIFETTILLKRYGLHIL